MVILAPIGSQPEAASLAKVVYTNAFCIGTLTAFAAVKPVSISIVCPFFLCFRRHLVADLAALVTFKVLARWNPVEFYGNLLVL